MADLEVQGNNKKECNNNIENIFLTPKDIMNHLQIGKDKVYLLCALKGFPAIKIGKTYRIDPQKYIKWINEHIGNTINL